MKLTCGVNLHLIKFGGAMTDYEKVMGRTVGQTIGLLIDGNFHSIKNELKLIRKYAGLLIRREELRTEVEEIDEEIVSVENEILESLGPDYMSELEKP